MIRSLLFTLLLVLGFSSLFSQTWVSGGIYNNVTWTLANSPYIVTGNIVVFPGKTLTIEPGVEVRVQGNGFNSPGGITIEVRGQIIAIGTASAPITFKADGIITDPWSWRGILIKASQGGDGEIDYVHISNAFDGFGADNFIVGSDTVRYNNCVFTHNSTAITAFRSATFNNCQFAYNSLGISNSGGGLLSLGLSNCDFDSNYVGLGYVYGPVTIDSCNFRSNINSVIANNNGVVTHSLFQGNETGVQGLGYAISYCTFLNNQTAVGQLSGGSVTDCNISNNQTGVELKAGMVLVNNEINNNVVGVRIWDPNMTFNDNRVCGNIQYNVDNFTDINISIVGNCFCESDSSVAEALLFDGYDDISRGLFNYALYDPGCNNVVQLVSKVNIPTGLSNTTERQFEIFPNPAQDELNLRFAPGQAKAVVRVLSLQGQVLREQKGAELLRIDVSMLPAGVYLLDVQGARREVLRWTKS